MTDAGLQGGGGAWPGPPPGYGQPGGWYGYPPPGWYPPPKPPKGWNLGLPPSGPGSLAAPARRLGARLLDGLFFLPFVAVLLTVVLVIAAPHFGAMFPKEQTCPAGTPIEQCPTNSAFPGFFWLEFTLIGAGLVSSATYIVLDGVLTARFGRTPGKAIMHIRPVHLGDRRPLTFWRSLARAAVVQFAGALSWIGILDYLWCLWDADSQCVHDKVVATVVLSDT